MQPIIFHLHTYVKVYIVNKINIHIENDRCSGVFLCFFKRPQKQWSYMPRGTRAGYREFIYLFMNLFEMFIDLEKKFIDLTFATSDREMFLDAMSLDIIEELNSPL